MMLPSRLDCPLSLKTPNGQSTHEVLVHEAGHALGIYGGFDDVEGYSRGHPILEDKLCFHNAFISPLIHLMAPSQNVRMMSS